MSKALTISDAETAAKHLSRSGFFKDAASESQAVVKVLAGQELGLGPFAAMTGIHIIKGKPALGANLIATLIKNDPRYDYRLKEMSNERVVIEFFEGKQSLGISSFTAEDARRVGTQNMQKFPRNMLFARAMSNGAKWFVPGIFGGAPVYTPDELGADVDEDGYIVGEVMEDDTYTVEPPEATVHYTDVGPEGPNWAKATLPRFIEYCIDTIERYDNEHAVRNALKLLSFDTWPVKGENVAGQREAMYTDLKQYASYRMAGMSQDDALAALRNELMEPVAG